MPETPPAPAVSLPMQLLRWLRGVAAIRHVEQSYGGRLAKELVGRLLLARFPVKACDRCGGRDLRPVYRNALRTVVACRSCGLEFAGHIPPGGFDAYFGIFDVAASYAHTCVSQGGELRDPAWHAATNGMLDRLLAADGFEARALAAAGSAYEIGFGSGALLALLRRRGWRVRGGDAGGQCVAAAQALDLEVERRTVGELAAIRERFDLVVAFHLLEHVESPTALLRDSGALLRPGGQLLFQVPLRPADPAIRYSVKYGYGVYGHSHFLRAADVRALAAGAGLRVVAEELHAEGGLETLTFTAAGG